MAKDDSVPARYMTLRDYFAGQALAGLYADATMDMGYAECASVVYQQADAMLAARSKEGGAG